VINIAEFHRAFFYFWIFGIISVLLDLDHVIQVYQHGMDLNLTNIAHFGTRPLHLPILILSSIIFIVSGALLLRFLHLSVINNNRLMIYGSYPINFENSSYKSTKTRIMVKLVASSIQ
jgi:hypothetical protein